MSEHKFMCADCGEHIVHTDSVTTGYDIGRDGKKVCYACCAKRDIAEMRDTGRAVLYLTVAGPTTAAPLWPVVTNWPGTLRIPVKSRRIGRHNFAGSRTDVWFDGPDGKRWHGVQLGENSQICRCRRLKAA